VKGAPDLSILIPVYNERTTVSRVVETLLRLDLPVREFEVILVDDGSTDGTRDLFSGAEWPENVRVVLHERNQGKGAAIRTGLTSARGTFTAIADADLELDVADIADVVRPLVSSQVRAAFGVRRFEIDTPRKFRYYAGNRGVSLAMRIAFGGHVSDIMTAFKAMHTDLFRELSLTESGFAIEAEITAGLLARGVAIHEVTVHYTPRARVDGKKLTMIDGLRVLWTIARCYRRARFARGVAPLQQEESAAGVGPR
jgi:dolichol-phosphate hexosyltransferase